MLVVGSNIISSFTPCKIHSSRKIYLTIKPKGFKYKTPNSPSNFH